MEKQLQTKRASTIKFPGPISTDVVEIEWAGSNEKNKVDDDIDHDENEVDSFEEDEEIGADRTEEDILGEYIAADMKSALYEARFVSPFFALLGLLFAAFITIYPYSNTNNFAAESRLQSIDNLNLIRPVLAEKLQREIQKVTMHAETHFWMPLPSYDIVTLVFHTSFTKHGTHQTPELFYDGVTFGITAENSHQLEYTAQSSNDYVKLREDLSGMNPKPTHVFLRSAQFNQTSWLESGYAVHFSYDDLRRQGKLSSDRLQPWKRVLDDVLDVARDYKQVYVTMWYPHEFGTSDNVSEPHKFKSIIQQIIPTRTGLNSLKSTATVWVSKINHTEPMKVPHVYRKPWTADDHWSHYLVNETERAKEKEMLRKLVDSGFISSEPAEIIVEPGDY